MAISDVFAGILQQKNVHRGDSPSLELRGEPVLRRLIAGLHSSKRNGRDEPAPEGSGEIARLFEQAEACHRKSDLALAEALYRRVLERTPASVRALQALGVVCAQTGRLEEARCHLERATELDRSNAAAMSDLGQVFNLGGSHERALEYFRQALEVQPHLLGAKVGMAQALRRMGDVESAVRIYQELVENDPGDGEILGALIEVLDGLGRHQEARSICESVLARDPAHAQAHASLGHLLVKRTFEPAAGLQHLELALAQRPGDPVLHVTRAIALRDLARTDDAIEACGSALAVDSANAMARFHRAIALLLKRDFARAWSDYEARLSSQGAPRREFPYPRWNGEALDGRTILVHAEQGIGDEIMFASCIPDLAVQAGHVILECSEKLARLFARSFPGVTVHGASQRGDLSWLARIPVPDCVTPIGSLPLHLRNDERSFKEGKAYLHADPRLVEEYRGRLAALGPGKTVGLSWRGGTVESRRALRSLDPAQLFPTLCLPGLHWVNLQYDATAAEVSAIERSHDVRIHHWHDAIADYERTAALVCALDLVISVCTAVVHLGGALGTPVWVAATHSPEWRYGIAGETMPWYGSVRIFRQAASGDWARVVGRIANELSLTGDAR